MPDGKPHRVVIVGGGFGGLYCAAGAARHPVDVTLIDRRNFHLFQPLLYQVATGGLSPANIAAPLRSHPHAGSRTRRVLLGEVDRLRPRGEAACSSTDGDGVPYDTLVVATGATHHYFGHAEWEPLAPGLKTIEDATEIRRRILCAFEQAEREPDPAVRQRLADVRGRRRRADRRRDGRRHRRAGPRTRCGGDFRAIDPAAARVMLVEGADRVLPHVPREAVGARRRQSLPRLGVEVLPGRARHRHPARPRDVTSATAATATERIDTAHGALGGRREGVAARPDAGRGDGAASRSDRGRPRGRSSPD